MMSLNRECEFFSFSIPMTPKTWYLPFSAPPTFSLNGAQADATTLSSKMRVTLLDLASQPSPQCIRLFLYSGLYSLIGKGLSGEHEAHYRAAAHLGAAGFIWDPCSAGQTLLTPFPDLDVFGKNSPPQSHLFPNLTTPQDRGRESDA